MTEFIDFYSKLKHIPTVQGGMTELDFDKRRILLYQDLGIPIKWCRGKRIIEFGPGGGYNAATLFRLGPAVYDFVDGMPSELAILESNLAIAKSNGVAVRFFQSLFTEFKNNEFYDLVIAEACIPGQALPLLALESVIGCVQQYGYLVITNTSKVSLLSEILRSVIGRLIVNSSLGEEEAITRCELFFQSHLHTLGAVTRSAHDWVLDNIIHDWHRGKSEFSLPEAYAFLSNHGFVYLGGSPLFLRDFTWYKNQDKEISRSSEFINSQYFETEILLLDQRLKFTSELFRILDLKKVGMILAQSCECFDRSKEYLLSGKPSDLSNLFKSTRKLESLLVHPFEETKLALEDFNSIEKQAERNIQNMNLCDFAAWWGRGQQYNSFYRVN